MSITNGIGMTQQALTSLATASTNALTQTDAAKQSGTSEAAGAGLPVQQDAATLTSAGGVLAQAVSGSDTNVAKVAALQQTIAAGTYNVSASDVADKLIASMVQQR